MSSPLWDNGSAVNAGALPWGDGVLGTSGVVSAVNSLIGSTTNDQVGNWGITVLPNGNYVVNSHYWDNGSLVEACAVTWGNGATGIFGVVSSSNSLVGTHSYDYIGYAASGTCINILSNGNYVIRSSCYHIPGISGVVTWADATTAITGNISPMNSIIGNTSGTCASGTPGTALGSISVVEDTINHTFLAPSQLDGKVYIGFGKRSKYSNFYFISKC